MWTEFLTHLSDWGRLDTWIVVTGALAATACALPGNYLVLRRQAMMGDALAHTALPGIVLAFLLTHALGVADGAGRHAAMFGGALVIGVLTAVLTEAVHKLGRVESSAALGVVFTSLFALGLLLIRLAADSVHLDPDCVLFGDLERVVFDTWGPGVPRAAVVNGGMLLVNAVLVMLFYKELRISTFDPGLATALGINASWMHYGLMAATAMTLVAAFESVGSILVIAMLIAPACAARLLTDRLGTMLVLSVGIAALSAVLGQVLVLTLPAMLFGRLGFEMVGDASAAGMIAVACGLLFTAALLFAPRQGLVGRAVHRVRLRWKIAREDVLGSLYRQQEPLREPAPAPPPGLPSLASRLALFALRLTGDVIADRTGYRLTEQGRRSAEQVVRAHRLWESYMARHFAVPPDHLHDTAARVEHYLDPALREELSAELDRPAHDPHGRSIPPEEHSSGGSPDGR